MLTKIPLPTGATSAEVYPSMTVNGNADWMDTLEASGNEFVAGKEMMRGDYFPILSKAVQAYEPVIFTFVNGLTVEAAEEAMRDAGWQGANFEQIATWAKENRNDAFTSHFVIAIGQVWNRGGSNHYPVTMSWAGKRRLTTQEVLSPGVNGYRVLAVRRVK